MHDESSLAPFLERWSRRARLLVAWAGGGARRLVQRPPMAQIEITNRCKMTCRTCTRLKLPATGDMAFEDFRKLILELGPVRRLWLSGQGEPLLHPDLPRMIRECVDQGIHETIVHTSGMLLEGERAQAIAASGLSELRISIDGGSEEDVEYLREGSSFPQIVENARAFVGLGSSVRTAFYVVLNRRNHLSVPRISEVAASAGVRRVYVTETVPFRDESTEREIYDRREYQFASLPADVRDRTLAEIQTSAARHGIDIRIDLKWHRKRCFEPFQKIYIDFGGNVTPCCRIHNECFVGNILEGGLEGTWYGDAMTRWRRDILKRSRHRRICVERCNLGIGADCKYDP